MHASFITNLFKNIFTVLVVCILEEKKNLIYNILLFDSSFDVFNHFNLNDAIAEDTIVIYDKKGKVIRKFGSNR